PVFRLDLLQNAIIDLNRLYPQSQLLRMLYTKCIHRTSSPAATSPFHLWPASAILNPEPSLALATESQRGSKSTIFKTINPDVLRQIQNLPQNKSSRKRPSNREIESPTTIKTGASHRPPPSVNS